MKQQTKIGYMSQSIQSYVAKDFTAEGSRNSRLKLFVITFIVSVAIGFVINYSRPAIYRSSASLLTSAATDVDENSADVDLQHVIIQKKKLLGDELLIDTLAKVRSLEYDFELSDFTLLDLRSMLDAQVVKETNLLNMIAEGNDPEILPLVINTWINVYLKASVLSAKNRSDDTVDRIKNEIRELEIKIEQSQDEIDSFRIKHDITSIAREENELPAMHIKLTNALHLANQEIIKSKAKVDTLAQAVATGQTIVPKHDQTSLAELEKEYRELSRELVEFDTHFTRDYLQYKGEMKYYPERIKKLEQQIKRKKAAGIEIVQTEASQDYYAALRVVKKIRRKLDENKAKATSFATIFSRYKKLEDDLESMRALERSASDRLVKIETKQLEKYSQVYVVQQASVNRQPIRPDYSIGSLIVLVTSLFLAFFVVWLRDYLIPAPVHDQGDRRRFRRNATPDGIARVNSVQKDRVIPPAPEQTIKQKNRSELPHLPKQQKISNENIQLLLDKSNKNTQQLILLLLSGLNLEEIASLSFQQIKTSAGVIELPGDISRSIPIGSFLQEKLAESLHYGELWEQQKSLSVKEMNAMLYCLAIDVGGDCLNGSLAEKLRQSYIVYLVEQGLGLSSLTTVVGYLSPIELASYAAFSLAGAGFGIDEIQLIHPLCRLDEK